MTCAVEMSTSKLLAVQAEWPLRAGIDCEMLNGCRKAQHSRAHIYAQLQCVSVIVLRGLVIIVFCNEKPTGGYNAQL
jgi:hypothetical protein